MALVLLLCPYRYSAPWWPSRANNWFHTRLAARSLATPGAGKCAAHSAGGLLWTLRSGADSR